MMGTGEAEGENRAIRAAEAAISNPLLEDTSMAGARGLLINITGGDDMTLFEVDQAANRIREEVAEDANIIFGSAVDDELAGRIRVSVVATGIDTPVQQSAEPAAPGPRLVAVGGGVSMPRPDAPRLPDRPAQPSIVQPTARFPVGVGATAVAYNQEETLSADVVPQPQASVQATQQHPLFTQPVAAPEPAPVHRPSLFGKVTGGWRRSHAAPPAPELPDLRRRNEPRMVAENTGPSAEVHAAMAEPDPAGLDIPAFLRRQDVVSR
jgi:cell division protein FtsZ